MKSTITFTLICALAIVFIKCGAPSSPNEHTIDTKEQKEDIKSTLTDMWDAIEKGDIERYASHVHPDFITPCYLRAIDRQNAPGA